MNKDADISHYKHAISKWYAFFSLTDLKLWYDCVMLTLYYVKIADVIFTSRHKYDTRCTKTLLFEFKSRKWSNTTDFLFK